MKIAITAHGEDHLSTVDSRFGRADHFVIYDSENGTWDCMSNTQNLEAAHGAGIQAGQNLSKSGTKVLITGHVGPKALRVLQAEKIEVYALNEQNCTVEGALKEFQEGKLKPINVPNALELKR
ncbi:NifB/NifX family molybdenum-iron cluster-binding protein [Dendrosporobacter sp. 1207_IL3150]|uniref:NifB/NifX family molybdenum-iron cluster-binding protein n=1 Tax=Dendrosporobacter sp. 1207_IL3150 TaxID=3084054 RepID=UPI002FDB3D8F